MSRLFLISFLALFSSFVSASFSTSLKRKVSVLGDENATKQACITDFSAMGPTLSVKRSYILNNKVDLHPSSLPQPEENLKAYMALYIAISSRDLDWTCLLLSVFPDLKLSRYVKDASKEVYINFYHLAFMAFSAYDFKTIVSFGSEYELIYPTSRGSSLIDIAKAFRFESKLEYAMQVLSPYAEKIYFLRQRVIARKIPSLFEGNELITI